MNDGPPVGTWDIFNCTPALACAERERETKIPMSLPAKDKAKEPPAPRAAAEWLDDAWIEQNITYKWEDKAALQAWEASQEQRIRATLRWEKRNVVEKNVTEFKGKVVSHVNMARVRKQARDKAARRAAAAGSSPSPAASSRNNKRAVHTEKHDGGGGAAVGAKDGEKAAKAHTATSEWCCLRCQGRLVFG